MLVGGVEVGVAGMENRSTLTRRRVRQSPRIRVLRVTRDRTKFVATTTDGGALSALQQGYGGL